MPASCEQKISKCHDPDTLTAGCRSWRVRVDGGVSGGETRPETGFPRSEGALRRRSHQADQETGSTSSLGYGAARDETRRNSGNSLRWRHLVTRATNSDIDSYRLVEKENHTQREPTPSATFLKHDLTTPAHRSVSAAEYLWSWVRTRALSNATYTPIRTRESKSFVAR